MEINDLKKLQVEQDELLGFSLKFSSEIEKYNILNKELVGLFGEIGEFSNIVKKINLNFEHENYSLDIDDATEQLKEEFSDTMIYLIRISELLEIDIEKEIIKKIKKNRVRFDGIK